MKITTLVERIVRENETRNPFTIAKNQGIHILRTELVDIRGFYMRENGADIIFVANDLDERPAQFVCAHELGHHFRHKGLNRVFMDRHTYMLPDKFENEADHFAAQLLYGEPPLTSDECLTDYQLAECLNVPTCSVNSRMMELGIYY